MNSLIPKIDNRNADLIFQQCLELAAHPQYCPNWIPDPKQKGMGVALLRLFSRLAEIVIGQVNRIRRSICWPFMTLSA